ncbi:MAG: YajQ family cyclic di-GMP-binding protein [Nitrospira sp.]|nr:YajQ family cyclic di-GMP-binding protein [Nitrospira sp.]TKB90498.1 MAG: YajQ family cyclic di-GMP-binding protein [Nitrospira sp.]
MADQFSFDVVSEVNMQELKNALEQATKEVKQRFDFKDSKTEITLKEKEKELVVVSDDEYKLNAVQEIIKGKCVKRGVSLKAFDFGAVEPALSGTVRQTAKIQSGLTSEKAKEITKALKDSKVKVQAQIQGEQLRVQGKSKDELQSAIAFLKGKNFEVDLQFTNYR